MFSKNLAEKIFEAFSVQRWNQYARPFDFPLMDTMASQMFYAFIIGNYYEIRTNNSLDWKKIINYGLFELFERIALSDINHNIKKNIAGNEDNLQMLNEFIIQQFYGYIGENAFFDNFKEYLIKGTVVKNSIEYKILRYSHKCVTLNETTLLETYDVDKVVVPIVIEIKKTLKNFKKGNNQNDKNFADFIDNFNGKDGFTKHISMFNKLRYQIRWAQTARIPCTSVLGHSGYTAFLSYLLLCDLVPNPCEKRIYNVFFSALYHDLGESVTADIISPVKNCNSKFSALINEIEHKLLDEELGKHFEDADLKKIMFEIQYFLNDEFKDKYKDGEATKKVTDEESKKFDKLKDMNTNEYSPLDGSIVKFADSIAAFIEADSSIRLGINSIQLQEGRSYLLAKFKDMKKYEEPIFSKLYVECNKI